MDRYTRCGCGEDTMSWKEILLKGERVYLDPKTYPRKEDEPPYREIIYLTRMDKSRGYNIEEVLRIREPKLLNKLNTHFEANPLTNDEVKNTDFKEYFGTEDFDAEKGFRWEEAFVKHGMEDGHYQEFTDKVIDYIRSLGYTVHEIIAGTHNNYIGEITME